MKKRFLKILIIFSFLFCLSYADAKECVRIQSTGNHVTIGNAWSEYYKREEWTNYSEGDIKQSGAIYDSPQDALNACRRRTGVIKGTEKCSGYFTKIPANKYQCGSQSYKTQAECKRATYTTGASKNSCVLKASRVCTKRKGIHLIAPYECPLNTSITGTKNDCNSKCKRYTCSSSGGFYYNSTCNNRCKATTKSCSTNSAYCKATNDYSKVKYGYKYRSVSKTSGSNLKKITGWLPVNIYEYKADGQDRTYCIQPGKRGPGNDEYCLNMDFDLHRCKTENHYFCGFAEILYQTVKEDGTYSDGSVKFVDNGKYDYGAVTAALRMWVAYAANGKVTLTDGEMISGNGEADEDYVTDTNVYEITANAVRNRNYMGSECVSSLGKGVMCTRNGYSEYKDALVLFKAALDAKRDFIKYESNVTNDPEFSHSSTTEGGDVTFTITTKIPESFQEKMVDCTKQEILNKRSDCQVYAELKDEKGNVQNTLIEDAKCEGKETCDFVVKAKRKECSVTGGTTETKYTLNLGLKGYNRGGYVRQYINSGGAGVSQIMLTFAFNEKKNEIDGDNISSSSTYKYTLPVPCYCDPTKYCDDFRAKGALKSTCDGYGTFGAGAYDTYEKSTYEDPYMNCILNACDRSKKEEFSYTQETGANSKVCNIYCRKELTFYLANKTKVYAGMQFSYDIASKVIEGEGDIDNVLTTDHKLTSIVLQKRQCTSEIYYNKKNADGQTWLDQYNTAVKNMLEKYNEWKKIEVLYDWEKNRGGPYVITARAKDTRTGSGTCKNTYCGKKVGDCTAKTIHTWPEYGYTYNPTGPDTLTPGVKYYNTWKLTSSCKANNQGEIVCPNSKASVLPNNDKSGSPNVGVADCGYSPCDYGESCSICNYTTVKVDGKDTKVCYSCYRSSYSTTNKCQDGENKTKDSLKDEEQAAWDNFKAAVKAVEQLYYDLQNCNFYVKNDSSNESTKRFPEKISNFYNDLDAEHHKSEKAVYANSSIDGSIKDYLLKQAYCKSTEECVSLVLGYEDDYGSNTQFSSRVDKIDSRLNNNYYCKNDGNKIKCYEYKQDEEVEIENTNKTAKHDRIVCSGVGTNATCSSKTIYLPTNDYATFITVTEADFWQPKSYKTSVYTGVVSEDDGSTDAGNSTPLGKEVFPVSNKTKKDKNGKDTSTGIYDINHKYSNLGLTTKEKFDYEYACNYEVFNTTKYYDCETNENGVTDLTKCKNPCYELKDGVPVILDSCDTWTPKDNNSKTYGFIYRNVDVGNLFPGKDIRDTGINWSSKTDVIEAIEKTADKIYTTDDYLEYRYVLTPSNIRQIREYNSSQNSNGGYLNETLSNCTMIDDTGGLKSFTECKSSFLDEVKAGKFGDIKVSGSKS